MAATKYFENGNAPMLPRAVAEGVASLVPRQPRQGITVDMALSRGFSVEATEVYPSIVESAAKLAYEEVPDLLGALNHPHHELIVHAARLAEGLLERRRSHGALVLYDLVSGWVTTEEGHIKPLKRRQDTLGHVIVQELMILANSEIAQFAITYNIPILFRNHVARAATPDRAELMRQIKEAVETPLADLEGLQTRTHMLLDRAAYAPTVSGHFGLNSPAYTHFTSPIRRYADLVNHRQIGAHLKKVDFPYKQADLDGISAHINTVLQADRQTQLEMFKQGADARAHRNIDRGRLTQLAPKDFERVVKVACRSGSDPTATFTEGFRQRLSAGRVPLVCQTTVFAEAPRTPPWDAIRGAIVSSCKQSPADAYSLLTQATQVAGWMTPIFTVQETGPDHARTFTAVAAIDLPAARYASPPFVANTRKEAQQRACVGLMAVIAGSPTPEFKPTPAATPSSRPKREIQIDPAKNPIAALQEYTQGVGAAPPQYEFTSTGQRHTQQFTCTATYNNLCTTGVGPSKQAAKAEAAKQLVLLLAPTASTSSVSA